MEVNHPLLPMTYFTVLWRRRGGTKHCGKVTYSGEDCLLHSPKAQGGWGGKPPRQSGAATPLKRVSCHRLRCALENSLPTHPVIGKPLPTRHRDTLRSLPFSPVPTDRQAPTTGASVAAGSIAAKFAFSRGSLVSVSPGVSECQ